MARLSAARRKSIPKSQFGVPAKAKTAAGRAKPGSFPIPDKGHAKAALGLIGNAPPADRPRIRAKANAMLRKGSSRKR